MLKAFNATGLPAVQWIIKLDPRGIKNDLYRCKQVTGNEWFCLFGTSTLHSLAVAGWQQVPYVSSQLISFNICTPQDVAPDDKILFSWSGT